MGPASSQEIWHQTLPPSCEGAGLPSRWCGGSLGPAPSSWCEDVIPVPRQGPSLSISAFCTHIRGRKLSQISRFDIYLVKVFTMKFWHVPSTYTLLIFGLDNYRAHLYTYTRIAESDSWCLLWSINLQSLCKCKNTQLP